MMAEETFKIIRLRQAVSAVLFKGDKFLMVSGKSWGDKCWCFPQGGILEKETHFGAVKRELKEELGTDKFEVIGKANIDHTYLFPKKIVEKRGCEGQFQTIWFVHFLGKPEDIKFQEEEISNHKWFDQNEIISSMEFPEQKETFSKVLEEFDKLRRDLIF